MIKKRNEIVKRKEIKDLIKKDYIKVLKEISAQIEKSHIEAVTAVNVALNKRNWLIGKIITEKQNEYKWGSNFLDKLAQDLQNIYPGNKGFSAANVYRMKAFYQAYQNIRATARELYDLPVFALPWFQNVVILQKVKDIKERLWYAHKSIENGWSRSLLETQLKRNLYNREGKAISNFKQMLPDPHSAYAQEAFKDPYVFDFLKLQDEHLEYELEQGLINNVKNTLLEMGKGFALVGSQYHLELEDEDYYLDLVFYHTKLKCYVVVELKAREFDPRDVGQLNFYLSLCDDYLRDKTDNPTIGLLLCKTKKNFTAEYALRGTTQPIGIAEYETELFTKLPKEFKSTLPSIKELEEELQKNEILQKKEDKLKIKKKQQNKKPK